MLPCVFLASVGELFVCFSIPALILAFFSSLVVYLKTDRWQSALAYAPLFLLLWFVFVGVIFMVGLSHEESQSDAEFLRHYHGQQQSGPEAIRVPDEAIEATEFATE